MKIESLHDDEGYSLGAVRNGRNGYYLGGALAEAVMLLEGAPSGLEDALFAAEDEKAVMTAATITARLVATKKALSKRRAVVCKAKTEHELHMERVRQLDILINSRLIPQLRQADARGDAPAVDALVAEIEKQDALRDVFAGRAVQWAKTQALGSILTKYGRTQANALTLAKQAAARGQAGPAKVLLGLVGEIGKTTLHYQNLRQKQTAR
jgi:hypothetical protein